MSTMIEPDRRAAVSKSVAAHRRVADKLAEVPGLTVADIRDLLGITRKHAVPLCEYLDRSGVTKRPGDLRVRAG